MTSIFPSLIMESLSFLLSFRHIIRGKSFSKIYLSLCHITITLHIILIWIFNSCSIIKNLFEIIVITWNKLENYNYPEVLVHEFKLAYSWSLSIPIPGGLLIAISRQELVWVYMGLHIDLFNWLAWYWTYEKNGLTDFFQ